MGIIYELIINNKRYIGQSMKGNRKVTHRKKLKANVHANKYLQNAFNKYQSFEFNILMDNVPQELLTIYEDLFIKYYRTREREYGYNLRIAADSNAGMKIWPNGRPELKGKPPWNKGLKTEILPTHCKKGHEMTEENTYMSQRNDRPFPTRRCVTCKRASNDAYTNRKG